MRGSNDATGTEIEQRRRYTREMVGALALYSVVLVATLPAVRALGENPARFIVAFLPMTGFALGVAAVYRAVMRSDEYQRDLLLRTFSICFGLTAATTFGYGFLETAGAPKLSMFAVWPLMAVLWIVVGSLLKRGGMRPIP